MKAAATSPVTLTCRAPFRPCVNNAWRSMKPSGQCRYQLMNGADPAHQGFSIWKTRDDNGGAAVDFPVQSLLIGCLRRVFGLAGDPFRHPTEPDASNRLRQLSRQRETYVNVRLLMLCPRCSVCRPQGTCAELRRGWARTSGAQKLGCEAPESTSFVRFASEL